MNARQSEPNRRKPDLKPLKLTDAQLDALAGVDGLSAEQVAAAKAWGTPALRALLAAQDGDGDGGANGDS
jgi:hypothetical protein